MRQRHAATVTVPDVVGLPFHVARDVAHRARVALANPDADGPPIGSLAWPGLFFIASQHPAAGSTVHEWDSVAVDVVEDGDATDRVPASPRDAPPMDSAAATAARATHLELDSGLPRAPCAPTGWQAEASPPGSAGTPQTESEQA